MNMHRARTILVVDDEDAVRRLIHMMLHGSGYQDILEAADAEHALQISGQYHGLIDLLLSDVLLGGDVTGVTLAHEITGARPDTRVVLMSGYEGCDGLPLEESWHFIRKPFLPSALIETVECALAGSRAIADGSVAGSPQMR